MMGVSQDIDRGMTIRDAVARYPQTAMVFAWHGLGGCGGAAGPLEPIDQFARLHHVDLPNLRDSSAHRPVGQHHEIGEDSERQNRRGQNRAGAKGDHASQGGPGEKIAGRGDGRVSWPVSCTECARRKVTTRGRPAPSGSL